jgi:15-cis-phytoene synthase
MLETALQALKTMDHAQYLACLFVPEHKREAFAALGGYAAELRRIPMLVSEPLPGEIRLQWWRDVLDGGISGARAGEAASHPIAGGLQGAMAAHNLPAAPLMAMAEARIFDLYHDPMPDIATLETYLGETEAALIQLGSLILDPANAPHVAEAAGHAGMAIGIANIVRQLARSTANRRMFIPADLIKAVGGTVDSLLDGDMALRKLVISAMTALGRDHLNKFKHHAALMPPSLRPAFLATSLSEPVFAKAEKAGAGAFMQDSTGSPLLVPIRFAYRAMAGW